eukprot:2220046-Pleurochrysis_carterae.AAC.1
MLSEKLLGAILFVLQDFFREACGCKSLRLSRFFQRSPWVRFASSFKILSEKPVGAILLVQKDASLIRLTVPRQCQAESAAEDASLRSSSWEESARRHTLSTFTKMSRLALRKMLDGRARRISYRGHLLLKQMRAAHSRNPVCLVTRLPTSLPDPVFPPPCQI